MEVTRVPLSERIGMSQEGRTAQPEYLPSLIRQWGQTSIRAYFGGCEKELEQFCELMRLSPGDDLTYQDMALMLFDLLYRDNSRGAEATQLLAAPVLAAWEKVEKRRAAHE